MIAHPSSAARGDVALIAMPFGGSHTPSLALSLLQAELGRAGISCDVHYLNLSLAERIGIERYDRYAENLNGAHLGEWIFSDCLFPRPREEGERFVEEVLIPLQRYTLEEIEQFEQDRELAGPFLADCLRAEDWSRYRIIGFTTTFEQNTPSLAFARMVRQVAPDSAIVFGGANCEGEMGIQLRRSFSWIDFVCTGEGDDVFPELARQILGRSRAPLPGIAADGMDPPLPARMVMDLDRLPHPDFSGYFERVARSPLRGSLSCWMPMETSRGCWWGEKHHCTFCGLNGLTMRFRSKSADRALEEMRALTERHRDQVDPERALFLTDNIFDMKYLTTLFPALRDSGLGITVFYETKANLSKDHVRTLAAAGVRTMQPGIESLHSSLLRLMRKGCTALQNVQLLKWCSEAGITPRYNLLYGFPGEDPRWFGEQAEVIRRIPHLTPPRAVGPVRLDRFSPYFADPQAHGIVHIRPTRPLSYIYSPLPGEELARIAYHFDYDYADGRDPAAYIGPMLEAVSEWLEATPVPFCLAFRWREALIVWDARRGDPGTLHILRDGAGRLYEFCDKVRGRTEVVAHARTECGFDEREAGRLLDDWREAGLLLEDDGCVLGLAVLAGEPVEQSLDLGAAPGRREDARGAASRPRDQRPRRHPLATTVAMDGRAVVLERHQGRVLILDELASAIWGRCDGAHSAADIAVEIATASSRPRHTARAEVTRIVEWFGDQALLEGGET